MKSEEQKLISEHFERLFRSGITPWKAHPPEEAFSKFVEILGKTKKDAKILDIGCGDGWISIGLAKFGFRVWGIDSSEMAIKKAKKDARQESVEVDFRLGDALDLPYEDSFFDGMVDRGLLHHILPENRPVYMKNILRILKKDALVYLGVFSMKNPEGIGQRFTRELVEELYGSNFEVLEYSEDPYLTDRPAHLLHFILRRKI